MRLETERLILRPWREEDLDAAAATLADPMVGDWLGSFPSREQVAQRMTAWNTQLADDGVGRFALERRPGGAVIGAVGLHVVDFDATPIAGEVEIGWHLDPSAWGCGYATEAGAAVLRYGFDILGLRSIIAFTAESNARSRAVKERLGFERQAWRDFDHPSLSADHPLSRHVVYVLTRNA
ncbi:MAG TPA: GNAT family N-acetyltransferase [Caulobacteraceae bacterium]|jgi:RimJ/RimL family protein N-acetyltransferase|nr:GNAT family N-acetyltransferase [Caulobacteraceae bacterium]